MCQQKKALFLRKQKLQIMFPKYLDGKASIK